MTRILLCLTLVVLPFSVALTDNAQPPASCAVSGPIRATPPKDPNADPFGSGPWYINRDRSIWAGWDAVRMRSGRVNKVLWIRPSGADLNVSARRLDGPAGKFEASIPCCYPTGFQASGLRFTEAGCWEVTAKAGEARLTFITWVAPAESAQ